MFSILTSIGNNNNKPNQSKAVTFRTNNYHNSYGYSGITESTHVVVSPPPRPSSPAPPIPSPRISGHSNWTEPSPPSVSRNNVKRVDTQRILTVPERRKKQREGYDIYQKNKTTQLKLATSRLANVKQADKEKEMKQMFDRVDTDCSGTISVPELNVALPTWGVELSSEGCERLIQIFSKQKNSKTLNFDEFKLFVMWIVNIKENFDVFDRNNTGNISKKELQTLFQKLFINIPSNMLQKIIDITDSDSDGTISFKEFSTMVIHLKDLQEKFDSSQSNISSFLKNPAELHAFFRSWGITVTVQAVQLYITTLDQSKISSMTFGDLVSLMVDFKIKKSELQIQAQKMKTERRKTGRNVAQRLTTQVKRVYTKVPPPQGLNKEAQDIIDQHRRTGKLYEDPSFPATPSSLFPSNPSLANKIVGWKRPSEISPGAKLYVDGVSSGDVIQGALGDCWFLSALSILAAGNEGMDFIKNLFVSTYPEHGFYQCRFFINGEWKTVTIDDLIPVDSAGKPYFSSCLDHNEFWVPILEKAYAKCHGSFEAIESGSISDGLVDLTGEAGQTVDIELHVGLWDTLMENMKHGFLMGCANNNPDAGEEPKLGILQNHAYAILDCVVAGGTQLLRLRNPWGKTEWEGRWSDDSKEWTEKLMKELRHTIADDGTFFMCFEDWCTHFNRLSVLRVLAEDSVQKWQKFQVKGEWKGSRAGGCSNFSTFSNNPQWSLIPSENDTIYVYLCQPNRRMKPVNEKRLDYQGIGIAVTSKTKDDGYRSETTGNIVALSNYVKTRENGLELDVVKDNIYLIIPNTYEPNVEMQYYLSIYHKSPVKIKELTEDPPKVEVNGIWSGKTAGGCTNHNTWRNNPQYLLTVKQKGIYSLLLEQPGRHQQFVHMGLSVWKTSNGRRVLESENTIWQSDIINSAQVGEDLNLEAAQYVVMPCTFAPNTEKTFTLKITGDCQNCTLVPVLEWIEVQQEAKWQLGLSGGCRNFTSWKNNPKFYLKVPQRVHFKTVISTKNDDPIAMGFYIFNKDLTDLKVTSRFMESNSVIHPVELDREEYVFFATTFQPNTFGDFIVTLYCDQQVHFTKID